MQLEKKSLSKCDYINLLWKRCRLNDARGGKMVKKNLKVLVILLAVFMVAPLLSPLFTKAEENVIYDDILKEDIARTTIEEEGPEEEAELELSEINEDFNPNEYDLDDGLTVAPLKIESQGAPLQIRTRSMDAVAATGYPSKFDLRKYGMVSPVKDQGPNGSCWAFATYGSMESILLRQKKGKFDFSEKHLRNMHGFDWSAEKGGNRDMAAAYLASGKGPIAEDDDPYDPVISVSPKGLRRQLDMEKIIYLPDVTNINEIDNLKWAISEYGGVYTTINSSSSYYENKKTFSMYNPGSGTPNHAVTIVGWDDTYPSTAFTQKAPGNGAWICKNSWGTSYMDSGFYYVSYYDAFVGKSPTVFIPKKKDLRGIIHQYDPLGATRSVGFKGEGYMANIFTAQYKELLHEVGLFNVANQTDYEIYVVKNVEKTSQLTSDRVKVASGSFLYPGYYTVDIDPVHLKEGEQFAIVVYMNSTKSKNNTPLPVETQIKGYSSRAVAAPGQSYFSKIGDGWSDLTRNLPNANFCIKAITTTGDEVPEKDLDNVDDHNTDITIDGKVKIRNITFDIGSQGFIHIDKKGILRYTVDPADAEAELEFGTDDKNVAVFKEGGLIYPVNTGNTNVYIKTKGGEIVTRFNVQVVNPGIRIPGRQQIEELGTNDYEPEPEPKPEPDPNVVPDDKEPDPIRPERDPSVAMTLFMKKQSELITEGTEFNFEPYVGVYPETAKRDFIYYSDKPDVVEARPDGILVAHKIGSANITVMTDNNLKTVFKAKVVPDYSKQVIEIKSLTHSERKGGVFRIFAEATVNGMPYNGPADLTVTAEDRTIERRVYFDSGKIVSKYHGGQIGVWRKDFTATLRVRDKEKTIKFFESKKPHNEAGPKVIEITRFYNSPERKAGIFRLYAEVTENGMPYNGDAIIRVVSGDHVKEHKVRIKNGKFYKPYTAGAFGNWRKEFQATLTIGDVSEEIRFGYK